MPVKKNKEIKGILLLSLTEHQIHRQITHIRWTRLRHQRMQIHASVFFK